MLCLSSQVSITTIFKNECTNVSYIETIIIYSGSVNSANPRNSRNVDFMNIVVL